MTARISKTSQPLTKIIMADSSTNDTIRTSKTLREKGEVVGRCVINMIKCFRMCKNKKKHSEDKEQTL